MNFKKIKSNRNHSIYCGPAACSVITGKSIECVESYINWRRGHRTDRIVRGAWPEELQYALSKLGYVCTMTDRYDKIYRPTLAAWLRERDDRSQLVIIHLTNHYVVVKGNKLIDNHTIHPVSIKDAPHGRCKVYAVYQLAELPSKVAGKIRRKRSDVFVHENHTVPM